MTDVEIRQAQSLNQVNDFGTAREADFPPASLGGQKFAAVKALVLEINKLGEEQSGAAAAARASTELKRVARLLLLAIMRAIRDTAKAMEAEHPGISDIFKIPTKNGDEALINAARAFVTAATPLKDDFLQREMPSTFLEDLTAAINKFESAANSVNLSKSKRVGTTAGLKNALKRAIALRNELNPIVRNKYQSDPAALAEWKSANHVELPPKAKDKNAAPKLTSPPTPPVK